MIYVDEKNYSRQIDILEYALGQGNYDVIFWLYPEVENIDLFDLEVGKFDEAEPVTTYEKGIIPLRTRRKTLSADVINSIRNSKPLIEKYCDSCVLYKSDDYNWSVCTIGHEGFCLVKDDSWFNSLNKNDFNVSLNAPDWW